MKIEAASPPDEPRRKGRIPKYGFSELPVGDVCMTIDDAKYSAVYSCVQRFIEANPGTEFRVARHGETQVRVWRLK